MVNLDKIVLGLSRSGAISGVAGGLAGTALGGALPGKKVARSALQFGALATVGDVAYTAYQRYRQGGPQAAQAPKPAVAEIAGSARPALRAATKQWDDIGRHRFETVLSDATGSSSGLLLVRAMIAAAAADGHMDSEEQARMFNESEQLGLKLEEEARMFSETEQPDPDLIRKARILNETEQLGLNWIEKARLFDELRHPLSLTEVVQQIDKPETAVMVYTASLVAIDESRPEGQTYLRELSAALELPEALVDSVHAEAQRACRAEAA